jgi:hypothetical protein
MLEKEGTEGEEEARRAYIAAREESNHAAEAAAGERVSSALIDRVSKGFVSSPKAQDITEKYVLCISIFAQSLKVCELLDCMINYVRLIGKFVIK